MSCSCVCGSITFKVPFKPIEIVRCYCFICSTLSNTQYTSFAKYFNFLKNIEKVKRVDSSNRAFRLYCEICNAPILMQYHRNNGSPRIWINTTMFQFDYSHIPAYDIFRE